jgi:hypothetical protein
VQVSKSLSPEQFVELCQGGQVVSAHGVYGPKVVLLPSGDYLKVFNPKGGLTKRRFFPKYKAFIRNTALLQVAGIPAVQVKAVYFLTQHQSYAVVYTPLHGTDLRLLAEEDPQASLSSLISFLVLLHQKGIYFRGIHLGNVLRLFNGELGLIDVADLRQSSRPLSLWMRARNLAHLLNNRDDRALYQGYGIPAFLDDYAKQAKICGIRRIILKNISICLIKNK